MGTAPHDELTSDPSWDPFIGRVIANKYLIEAQLGHGAMGVVYRVRHTALERTLALKMLRPEFAQDPQFAVRFSREAKAASWLDHPNLVRVFDFGTEPDGLHYIVLEYVEGQELSCLLHAQAPLEPGRIISILSQILSALEVAHQAGILHRDMKPENVLIQRGVDESGNAIDCVKVCDFGIAKLMDSGSPAVGSAENRHLTGNLLIGTPAYMSPEQARGDIVDARSDIYSVGLIAYQLLCGRLPFEATSPFAVAYKQINEEPVAPSSIVDSVDPHLESWCLRAIRKQPADRFQSAREMRVALRGSVPSLAASSADAAQGHSRPEPSQRTLPQAIALGAVASSRPDGTFNFGATCTQP